jgi:hypothetical protein
METRLTDHTRLDTSRLPTPESLAEDLEKIVHHLDEWESLTLLALRALPSVRFAAVDDYGVARTNFVIPRRIDDAIHRLADERTRRALENLLDFGNPDSGVGVRLAASAEALEKKYETFRKGGERPYLARLASEIMRGELAWATQQVESPDDRMDRWTVNAWCEMRGWERTLIIDDGDPRKQTWTTRMTMRCVKHDIPYYVTSQRWSGGGNDLSSQEPGELAMLPTREEDRFNPEFIECRPASHTQPAVNLYLWFLGGPREVGSSVELHWQQILIDKREKFVPYCGLSTDNFPNLERLCLRVKLPSRLASEVVVKRFAPQLGGPITSYSGVSTVPVGDPIVISERDADGFFTFAPPQVKSPYIYEMWWGEE